jgi:alpha-1,6-mannosyltransferase
MPASQHAAVASGADRRAMAGLVLIAVVMVVLTGATVPATRAGGDYAYVMLALVAGALALAATRLAERADGMQALWLVAGTAIVLRVVLLVTEPLLSTDIYRYVWDGKVQAAGINPYRYVPADEALAFLRDEAVYPNINRPDYAHTIYPPVAQMFFFLATRLGENVTAMKLALLACEAVTVAAIGLLLLRLGRPLTRLVAYLWHPLPLWQIANSGHVDALMVALMMLGLWLALSDRPLRGAAAVTLGALAKPFALLALPATWRPWDWKAPLVVMATAALCYVPYLSAQWGVFGYLATGYLGEEHYVSGDNVWPLALWRLVVGAWRGDVFVYFVLAALLLTVMGLHATRETPRNPSGTLISVHHIILTFLFVLSPNYPWYFLMATPFVALLGGAPAWTFTLGAILLQDETRLDFFVPLLPRKTVIYGAFLCACGYAAWHAWRERSRREQQT